MVLSDPHNPSTDTLNHLLIPHSQLKNPLSDMQDTLILMKLPLSQRVHPFSQPTLAPMLHRHPYADDRLP